MLNYLRSYLQSHRMRINPKYIPLLATAIVLVAVFGTGALLYPNFGTPRVVVNLF